ncbi:Multicopper oxidase domain containing protein [Elaphomyces granulatus]
MKLHAVWTGILYVFDLITLSPERSKPLPEAPLPAVSVSNVPTPVSEIPHKFDDDTPLPPIVGVPRREGAFECPYPDMIDFENCHGPGSRGCWLYNPDTGEEYNITTDYDDPTKVPKGIVREFWLQISDMPISPDGVTMEHGKVFNRTYPGPWIEACWGDTIKVHITNNLRFNGTSIHFHGIRMLNNVQNDGVNGVTQCPIAPGDSFTYEFHATQYGSSWYHSHYSLQYGDGAVGPITIHGPATADFESDEAFKPLLLTDWNHRSVFEDWAVMLQTQSAPEMTNILLNGIGQFGPSTNPNRPKKYNITFNEGHTHFMRIINTAVDTAFIFTIDDHTLEVIEADFVPIVPYTTPKILVGIGQRYHVLVRKNEGATADNYWIRTIPARKCSKFYCGPDEEMGIVRYNANSTSSPTTDPFIFGAFCADEPYESLVPMGATDEEILDLSHSEFNVSLHNIGGAPYVPSAYIQRWDIHLAPFRIDFSEPTVLNLDQEDHPKYLSVVTANADKEDWIWLVISAPAGVPPDGARLFVPAAHPMHLHGHDFALLRQSENSWLAEKENITLDCSDEKIKCDNPPRRDVALLPAKGYIIIAFKADNPGVWLIHCHIAFHASSGLVLQIIENGHLIPEHFNGEKLAETERVCSRWDNWFSNSLNHWDFENPDHFQDDSGV